MNNNQEIVFNAALDTTGLNTQPEDAKLGQLTAKDALAAGIAKARAEGKTTYNIIDIDTGECLLEVWYNKIVHNAYNVDTCGM